METAIKPLDIHIIALDETNNWDLEALAAAVGLKDAEQLAQYLKRIEGVYYFNKNERTHCCEVTPSYCLYWYDNRARFHYGDDGRFAIRQGLEDKIDDAVSQQRSDGQIIYIHSHQIDILIENIKEEGNDFRYRHYGDPLLSHGDEVTTDEVMEFLREAFQANAPL